MQAGERTYRETGGEKCKEVKQNKKLRWITKLGGSKPTCQVHTRGNKERKRRRQGGGERKRRQNQAWRVRTRERESEKDRETGIVADNNSALGMSKVSVPAGTFLSSTSKAPLGREMGSN